MNSLSNLMRKYADIVSEANEPTVNQEGRVAKWLRNKMDAGKDSATRSRGRDDGYINPPPAPGEKFAVPAATAIVGTPIAGAYLQHNSKESERTADRSQASSKPTAQQSLPIDVTPSTAGAGRGDAGMPRAKSSDGVAVATGKGVQGTTTIPQGPKTAEVLAQLSKGQFATRADRLDQAKVDSVLGAGLYRAGSAEANQALANHFRDQLVQQTFQDNLARSRAESERQQLRLNALALQDQEREVQRQELQFRQRDRQ